MIDDYQTPNYNDHQEFVEELRDLGTMNLMSAIVYDADQTYQFTGLRNLQMLRISLRMPDTFTKNFFFIEFKHVCVRIFEYSMN